MFNAAKMKKGLYRARQIANQGLGRAERTELSEEIQQAEKRVEAIKIVCKALTSKLESVVPGVGTQDSEKRRRKIPETALATSLHECAGHMSDELLKSMFAALSSGLMEISGHVCHYGEQVEHTLKSFMQGLLDSDIPKLRDLKKKLEKQTLDADATRSRMVEAQKKASTRTDVIRDELAEQTQKMDTTLNQYTAELYAFMSKESELAMRVLHWVEAQVNYHALALQTLEKLVPELKEDIAKMSTKSVFECTLEEHLLDEDREISVVIESCVTFLNAHAMDEEGLFRVAGGTSRLKSLKASFNNGAVNMEDYLSDVHAVAGTMKQYLRELPEPLMTFDLYDDWIKAAQTKEHTEKMKLLWSAVDKLPKPNFDNLRYLIKFMVKLAKNSAVNKMTPGNLAIVMGPNLLWSRERDGPDVITTSLQSSVVELLITQHDYFFKEGAPDFTAPAGLPNSTPKKRLSLADSKTKELSTPDPVSPGGALSAMVVGSAFGQLLAGPPKASGDKKKGGPATGAGPPLRPTRSVTGAPSGGLSPNGPAETEGKEGWVRPLAAGSASAASNGSHSLSSSSLDLLGSDPPPKRLFDLSSAPPPTRMHGDVYDTAFALLTLKGGVGSSGGSSSGGGRGGTEAAAGDGAGTGSEDYLSRVRSLWDTDQTALSSGTSSGASDTLRRRRNRGPAKAEDSELNSVSPTPTHTRPGNATTAHSPALTGSSSLAYGGSSSEILNQVGVSNNAESKSTSSLDLATRPSPHATETSPNAPRRLHNPPRKKLAPAPPPIGRGHTRAQSDVSLHQVQASGGGVSPVVTGGVSAALNVSPLSSSSSTAHSALTSRPSVPPPSRPLGPPPPAPSSSAGVGSTGGVGGSSYLSPPAPSSSPFWEPPHPGPGSVGSAPTAAGIVRAVRVELGPPPLPPAGQTGTTPLEHGNLTSPPPARPECLPHTGGGGGSMRADTAPSIGGFGSAPLGLPAGGISPLPRDKESSSFGVQPPTMSSFGHVSSFSPGSNPPSRTGSAAGVSRSRSGSSTSGPGRKLSAGTTPPLMHSREHSLTGLGGYGDGPVHSRSNSFGADLDGRTAVHVDDDEDLMYHHQRSNSQSNATFL